MTEQTANDNQQEQIPDLKVLDDLNVPLPDYENVKDFEGLYQEAYKQIYHDLKQRLATNPVPTEEELSMGAFVEELEPQVRDAVLKIRRKGYNAENSGFDFEGGPRQIINGLFSLPEEVGDRLRSMGFMVVVEEVARREYTNIGFVAEKPDMNALREQWDLIVNLLPDLGEQAKPNENDIGKAFRLMYGAGTLQNDFMPYWLRDILGVGVGQHKEIYDREIHY